MPIPTDLRNSYIRSAQDKKSRLDEYWLQGRSAGFTPESLEPLMRYCHQLAGSGGSYGFPDLGDAARSLELAIASSAGSGDLESAYDTLKARLDDLAGTALD